MCSYVSVEDRVSSGHSIRKLRVPVDSIFGELDGVLTARHTERGRPSIPPQRLPRAAPPQLLYSVRGERLLMERLNYNTLSRWFGGLNVDDPVRDHSTFSFNRKRLRDQVIAQQFFAHTVLRARTLAPVSDEYFSADSPLPKAWASRKSSARRMAAATTVTTATARAPQRHPRLHHRPERAAEPQGQGEGREAELSGQCPDGKSATACWRPWTYAMPVAPASATARWIC